MSKEETEAFLAKAARSFEMAELQLREGAADFAASRTYYGCFYIAQALLASLDLEFGRHGQVIAQYGLHFAKTRRLDPVFHQLLDETFRLRQMADYAAIPTAPIEADRVDELIREGRRFLAAATEYLQGTPPSAE
jgi:uncharacterized protein (UPF0332 family)